MLSDDDDTSRGLEIRSKDFCNMPGVTKLKINEQDIAVITCEKS